MDTQLNETLDYIGAVLIVGPKWSGLFILTGSNADDEKQIMHFGTGRITKLQMYPMSLYESREFNGSISLYEPTLYSYLNILKGLNVIEDVTAWSPSIRSASAMRSGDKKEFTDPSIAVAILNLSPEKLPMDLHAFGFICEALCIRDLKIDSNNLGGKETIGMYLHITKKVD